MALKGSANFGPRGSTALGFGGHAHRAFPITTNKAPTEWVEIFGDEALTTAILDRILFHCDVIKLDGSSYRMDNRSGFLKEE